MELYSAPQVARPPEQRRRITNKTMMLKDYLWHDTSSADGFLSYPRRLPKTATVRSLLELDLSPHGRPKLVRTSSKVASAAISKLQRASNLLLNAVKFIHHKPHLGNGGDSHKPSFLPRSLSRRLSRSKRSRQQVDHNQHMASMTKVKDIMRWNSFSEANFMSPNKVLSPLLHGYTPSSKSVHGSSTTWSSCTCSDSDFSLELGSTCSSDFLAEQVGGYGGKRSPARRDRRRETKKGVGEEEEESVVAPATYYRKPKVKGGEKGGSECSYEEKEQLSPVSVLDFPDEDGNSPSSSSSSSSDFHRLANVERAKKKFMQKIRRFESLAELEPVNLESQLSESELYCSPTSGGYRLSDDEAGEVEEEDHAKELLMNYVLVDKEEELTKADRELVMDFLSEGLGDGSNTSVEELVVVAEKWAIGRGGAAEGRWGVEDMREWHVKEIEGDGRWRTFGEEAAEVAAVVAMAVVEQLIIELVC